MKRAWIKLFVEILDDVKLGPLPVWLKWRFVELLLVAAEIDCDGLLPPVPQMAWRLRVMEDDLVKSLRSLSEIGVVSLVGDRWKVTNFEKRQSALSGAERQAQFRKRHSNEDVTEEVTKRHADGNEPDVTSSTSTSTSNSSSVSSEERGGVGEKTKAALDAFRDRFGKFTSEKEIKRWLILFDAVGKDNANDLLDWAFKKEIHLSNRPGLLDSLETAAKNWKGKSNGNGKHAHNQSPSDDGFMQELAAKKAKLQAEAR